MHRISPNTRFAILVIIGLLAAPLWYWIGVRQGNVPSLVLISVVGAELIMVITLYIAWKVKTSRR